LISWENHDSLSSAFLENKMITIIKGGQVFSPESLGEKDILILGNKIGCVSDPGQISIVGMDIKEVDASDKLIFPGFIDSHAHILGGGGEGGPTTRAPEIRIEDIISSGVTTIIGCLGTDGTTRHMESLLAKARALDEEGITTFLFTGSYQIPVKTLTSRVQTDLILIDKIIGAGEIAISDHRSSQPTFADFARLAAECRVGGMLGGKAGILHCHLGDGKRKLEMLFQLIKKTEIPISQIIPTHVNRNPDLLKDAVEFMRLGGYVDLTAEFDPESKAGTGISIAEAVQLMLTEKVSLTQVTVSSDSNGSLPTFNSQGILTGLTIATQKSLINNFRHLVQNNILKHSDTIKLFSTNPAEYYKLYHKGKIKKGKDADLVLFDKDLNLTDVYAKGQAKMIHGHVRAKGTFSTDI
jgi:beta-aspartyl-dipeptidase (metallo-type)